MNGNEQAKTEKVRLLTERIMQAVNRITEAGGDLKGAAKVMEEYARSPHNGRVLARKARDLEFEATGARYL